MAFPWTLQGYIFREMGRTFLLTAVALTGILGLGGGVMNMIKLGDVTPQQLLRLMVLFLPVAAALTLPVAALFSATATYGRLAADNEFVACQSSGINILVLFLPSVALSAVTAAISFIFINVFIPGMIHNLNALVHSDLAAIIQRRLGQPRGIALPGGLRLHADQHQVQQAGADTVTLDRVAFVQAEGEEWVRYGTARQARLVIDRGADVLRISGVLLGLSYYDQKAGHFFEEARQDIPPNEVPSLLPVDLKFLTLGELLHYWASPGQWREVAEEVEKLRAAAGRWSVLDELWQQWQQDKTLRLEDTEGRFVLRAERAGRVPQEPAIEMKDVHVDEQRPSGRRIYTARRVLLEVPRSRRLEETLVRLTAFEVNISDGVQQFDRGKETLGPVAAPSELLQRLARLSPEELMGPTHRDTTTALSDLPLEDLRQRVRDARDATVRKIAATLSQRFAFSGSVLVLVLVGTALGIVLRGAHVVTAFGISFVPSLLVIVTIVMGKQMAQNAPTQFAGLCVMWSGLAAVAGLDVWLLTRVVRR